MEVLVSCIWLAVTLTVMSPDSKQSTLVRWKVEVFHKTLKSHTGLAKSPTKAEAFASELLCSDGAYAPLRTQTNHIFMSIYAAFQLECLKLKHKMNHFALRSRIYIRALQHAMFELQSLKSA